MLHIIPSNLDSIVSGKGPGGGMDFQSRLAAVVAAHILARRALSWSQLSTRDVPTAVSVETGGSGDDLRVELAGTTTVYECQAKRGLSADSRLDDAITLLCGPPASPEEVGLLLVDRRSARTITEVLHDGLDAWRQRVNFELKGSVKRVIELLREKGVEQIAERLHVRTLDVEQDASPGAQNAILLLERILDDPDQASAAWSVLVSEGLRLCREGGRRDFDSLVARLGHDKRHLAGSGQGAARRLDQIQVQLEVGSSQADQRHEEIKALLANLPILVPPIQPISETGPLSIQLDTARHLVENGKARAGLDLLRTLDSDIGNAVPATRVRFYNLQGAALLHLDRTDEARLELMKVLEISPDDLTALSNLAQAESLAGNADLALQYADQVVKKEPLSRGAWIVIIQRRPDAAVPEAIANDPNILTAKGFADSVAGRWDSAIDVLRRALGHGFDPERALFLAQALYSRAFEELGPSTDAEGLSEAKCLLDEICKTLQDQPDSSILERALITRGQLERLLGNYASADADFTLAATYNPESPRAAYMLATSYLWADEPDKALYTVERIPPEKASAEIHMVRARVFLNTGRKSQVRAALEQAIAQRQTHTRMAVSLTLGLIESPLKQISLTLRSPFWPIRLWSQHGL